MPFNYFQKGKISFSEGNEKKNFPMPWFLYIVRLRVVVVSYRIANKRKISKNDKSEREIKLNFHISYLEETCYQQKSDCDKICRLLQAGRCVCLKMSCFTYFACLFYYITVHSIHHVRRVCRAKSIYEIKTRMREREKTIGNGQASRQEVLLLSKTHINTF